MEEGGSSMNTGNGPAVGIVIASEFAWVEKEFEVGTGAGVGVEPMAQHSCSEIPEIWSP